MLGRRAGEGRLTLPSLSQLLAVALAILTTAYIVWKVTQSGEQALQFAFNGLSVGAVYALLAMGFTLVYSTVWFFDLYYGAAAALGAYGVFYLRSQGSAYGFEANDLYVNIVFAAVTAGVTAWVLHIGLFSRLRARVAPLALRVIEGDRRRCRRGLRGVCAGLSRRPARYPQPRSRSSYGRRGRMDALPGLPEDRSPLPARRSSSPRPWRRPSGPTAGFW